MNHVTVPIRVRNLYWVKALFRLIFIGRWCMIIRSNEHALSIAKRAALHHLHVEVGKRKRPQKYRCRHCHEVAVFYNPYNFAIQCHACGETAWIWRMVARYVWWLKGLAVAAFLRRSEAR